MERCLEPGAVTPEDLLAYAIGQADHRAMTHIEACSFCAAEAARYAATDEVLRSRLFRVDCPPPQTLGELALDLLAPKDTLTVRAHLSLCPHCSAELASLSEALRDDPLPEPGRKGSGRGRIFALLRASLASSAAPEGVRSAGESAAPTYEAAGITISLAAEADGSGPARRWRLLALVVDEIDDRLVAGAPLRLRRGGKVVSECRLDEWGNAIFSGLDGGDYVLELTLPDRVIAVDGVEVGTGQE